MGSTKHEASNLSQMPDKEVGELWRHHLALHVCKGDCECVDIRLIRKLVEERAAPARCEHEKAENIAESCRSFGIDPETW